METIELIDAASARHRIPYTIRSHAYDIADQRFIERLDEFAPLANGDRCLGVLAFPYARRRLEVAGFTPDKIIDTGPVFWFDKFYNPAPRDSTGRMLAMGSAWPKKNFEALVDIAPSLPNIRIDIYASGGLLTELKQYNADRGAPITFLPHVPFPEMPAVYRRYDWYIYTGKTDQCGMPVSILEAQASGIGVLHQYTRPEDHALVNGGGYVYDEIEDVPDIVAAAYPADMRARGFENASYWDIRRHIGDIAGLWYDHLENKTARLKQSFAKDFKQSFLSRLRRRMPDHVPVYIIHLTRDFGRHLHVCETLLPKLQAAEVIPACDGIKIEPLSICKKEGIKAAVDEYKNYTPAKFACSLSHIKACKAFLATGARFGVILEDDIDVVDDFDARLRAILASAPERFDILHLYVHPKYAADFRRRAEAEEGDVVRYAPGWGRAAYVVSRAGAKKIVKGFQDIKNHGDVQIADMSANDDLRVYCARDSIVNNLGQEYVDYRGERFRSNLHPATAD